MEGDLGCLPFGEGEIMKLNIKIKKGMSNKDVNNILERKNIELKLIDKIYKGAEDISVWKCSCGETFKRPWSRINNKGLIQCESCRYNAIKEKHKKIVEKHGKYKYINSYFVGDKLPSGEITKRVCLKVIHNYCGVESVVRYDGFLKHGCSKCCQEYENSFAYFIEKELCEPINKYWDFEKNTVNPYHIWKNSPKYIWIKCINKDYHPSYEIKAYNFVIAMRKGNSGCSFCNPCGKRNLVHFNDSFAQYCIDNIDKDFLKKYWSKKNTINPFTISPKSHNFIYIKCQDEKCDIVYKTRCDQFVDGTRCPECKMSKGEKRIKKWILKNKIKYVYEKEFKGLIGLGGGNLSYDFYLSKYNLLVEYQGHFHDGSKVGKYQLEEDYLNQLEHDKRKREYATTHKLNLLEIKYKDFNNIEEILEKEIETLKLR